MRRRQETLSEKIYRFRGVIFVVSVPLALIAVVFALMPRSAPLGSGQMPEDPLDRSAIGRGGSNQEQKSVSLEEGGIAASDTDKFAVIIDAGSTGSRIHVYKFNKKLELQEVGDDLELFIKIKPGLSKFADEPAKGGDSLRQLLDKALEAVPEQLQKSTPVRIGATAGLRLLPGDQADKLLEEARKVLADYPFTYTDDAVKILDGADEGSFAWVTVNYLLGFLGQEIEETVGVVDLGGGSVQLTYAVSDKVADKAPEGYIRKLSGMGKAYNVYVHSYLGYGLMAARAALLADTDKENGNPCLARGFDDTYEYARKKYPAVSRSKGGNYKLCAAVASESLKLTDACTFEKCAFNGKWSGGGGAGLDKVYVASYFFDRAAELGVIPDPKVSSVSTTAADFEKAAKKVCTTPLPDMEKEFPLLDKKDAGYACLDITYQYTLLVKGFGVDPDKSITLVKQIAYKGKEVEAAWPLGAAIAAMS